ncbi:MAG: terpene cyclase/mutase family protein, partial [Gemmatimonadetes bacterium]|nr:terpene cyclase/mutase family protein [Gemmatimonadota bacterium]
MTKLRAILENLRDGLAQNRRDPGADAVIETGLQWLCRAQDSSATRDGGVARHYDLLEGWGPSYPETTGYIVSTLLDCAPDHPRMNLPQRARRMLDWLVAVQLPGGAFPGGTIGEQPVEPVTFNTGQILLGLCSGVEAFGDAYRPAMLEAAVWLVATQDPDGCWRRFPSPFTPGEEKVYYTHAAWSLIETERLAPDCGYAEAAHRNALWALTQQLPNGWPANCCLNDVNNPLTHRRVGIAPPARTHDGTTLCGAMPTRPVRMGKICAENGQHLA